MSLRAKGLWQVLGLRLALLLLLLLWPVWISRLLTVAVGHRSPITIRRIYGALLSESWSRARIVLWVRTTIVAIDGLANWRGALHHVGRLARHGGRAIGNVPV